MKRCLAIMAVLISLPVIPENLSKTKIVAGSSLLLLSAIFARSIRMHNRNAQKTEDELNILENTWAREGKSNMLSDFSCWYFRTYHELPYIVKKVSLVEEDMSEDETSGNATSEDEIKKFFNNQKESSLNLLKDTIVSVAERKNEQDFYVLPLLCFGAGMTLLIPEIRRHF